MEDFCRTCGKTVNAESCINIFRPRGRSLLNNVRTITNCWVENAAGFPIYVCEECQMLLKKINSFRKRCTKIEAFLTRRKSKLSLSNGISPAATDKARSNDPLRIEEPDELGSADIKVEPTITTHHRRSREDGHAVEPNTKSYYEDQPESDNFVRVSFDEDLEETPTGDASNAGMVQQNSIAEAPCQKSKRNYTMRVGKRTMYIKLTDDQQPKRIVDRERQWASARPCICEHCGRQFKDGSNLNVHLLRHTGTKNYECTECNEKCYTLHLLRRHQLKHTEGPYECTFCGLQYSTKSSRVRHEREACKKGRGPQSKTELIKRGERTFHCDDCDLWFLRAGNLTQHMNSSNHIANARLKTKRCQSKHKKSLNMDARDDANKIL